MTYNRIELTWHVMEMQTYDESPFWPNSVILSVLHKLLSQICRGFSRPAPGLIISVGR